MNIAILFGLIFLVWFLTVVLLTPKGQRYFVVDLSADPPPPSFAPVPASGWYALPEVAPPASDTFHVEADDTQPGYSGGWWSDDD